MSQYSKKNKIILRIFCSLQIFMNSALLINIACRQFKMAVTFIANFRKHTQIVASRSSHSDVFLVKGVLKKCSKFAGEHPYLIEITLRHERPSVHFLHIFLTPFSKSTSEWLLLYLWFICNLNKDYFYGGFVNQKTVLVVVTGAR